MQKARRESADAQLTAHSGVYLHTKFLKILDISGLKFPLPPPKKGVKEVAPNVLNLFGLYDFFDNPPETYIPFWKSEAKFLFIAGAEDQICKSVEQALAAQEIMENNDKKDNVKVCSYEGLGHLIDLPFSPPCSVSRHVMFPRPILIEYGGTDQIKHGQAQEKIWFEILDFLKMYL